MPAPRMAPMGGASMYIHIPWYLPAAKAGPSVLAGFIDPPVLGLQVYINNNILMFISEQLTIFVVLPNNSLKKLGKMVKRLYTFFLRECNKTMRRG